MGLGRPAPPPSGATSSSTPREGYTPEWEILARLGWYCTGGTEDDFDFDTLDDGWFTTLCHMYGRDPEATLPLYDHGGPERMIDLQVRMGPWGDRYGEDPDGLTLEKIKDAPHGIDLGPMVAQLDAVIGTPSGKVELAPPYILGDLPRLKAALERDPDGYVLVSRRHIRSKNSWMHNVKVLVKGKDRCTLIVHPDDASQLGLVDGELARVSSEAGALEVPVEVSDEMMRGVVSLPHGWGHDQPGTRLVGRPRARRRQQQPAGPRPLRRRAVGQRRGQRHPCRGGARGPRLIRHSTSRPDRRPVAALAP